MEPDQMALDAKIAMVSIYKTFPYTWSIDINNDDVPEKTYISYDVLM